MSRFLLLEIKATIIPSWGFDGYLDPWRGLNTYGWNLVTILIGFLIGTIVSVFLAFVILKSLNEIL